MDIYKLEEDHSLFCKAASSFPGGVKEAHEALHRLVDYSPHRNYFGLSWLDRNGSIIYKAAAEELTAGELSKHKLEQFTLRQGNYIYTDVKDFMKNIPAIGQAFDLLKKDSRIDPQGAAVEWYLNASDVRCMIRIK